MDNSFCVAMGLIAVFNHGVYDQTFVKNDGKFWADDVPKIFMEDYFKQKQLVQ